MSDRRRGTLHDTYHAALQHSHVEPRDDDFVLGVVQKPLYGISAHLDDNWPALAPSEALLSEFKSAADALGHNAAVDAVEFRERYRKRLENGTQQQRIDAIEERLAAGQDVWLVCYEGDDKFCHRRILKQEIEAD